MAHQLPRSSAEKNAAYVRASGITDSSRTVRHGSLVSGRLTPTGHPAATTSGFAAARCTIGSTAAARRIASAAPGRLPRYRPRLRDDRGRRRILRELHERPGVKTARLRWRSPPSRSRGGRWIPPARLPPPMPPFFHCDSQCRRSAIRSSRFVGTRDLEGADRAGRRSPYVRAGMARHAAAPAAGLRK